MVWSAFFHFTPSNPLSFRGLWVQGQKDQGQGARRPQFNLRHDMTKPVTLAGVIRPASKPERFGSKLSCAFNGHWPLEIVRIVAVGKVSFRAADQCVGPAFW